jgi:hypothetical protein
MNAQNKNQYVRTTSFSRFKERITVQRITKFDLMIALLLVFPMILSACGAVPALAGAVPVPQPEDEPQSEPFLPPVFGPDAARDAALAYVRDQYSSSAPGSDRIWVGSETQTDAMVGSSVFQYISDQWSIRVSYPLVAPQATIYTVALREKSPGFVWEGLVDAYGQAATTAVSGSELTMIPEITDPAPSNPPVIGTLTYRDDKYKIAMEYPADWSLTEVSAGVGSDAKALRLQKGTWFLVVHYKLLWDQITFGGGLPVGDVIDRGWTTLLGRSVPKHYVVYNGKDKVLFYGDRFEDLEVYIRLDADFGGNTDYYAVDIPDHIVDEAVNIVANIIRTGPPISPPVPTPTLIPPTPTPVPVPCNAISFQADLTIQDGTVFAPNADFIKTWRVKNIGSCSWNTDYDLVFVEGDQMDAAKAITLPENIRPGERLDISVTLTSPSKRGEYRGYWMLRSGDGEWFGYGKAANKPFWVDIEVVVPEGDYKYDFALNLCAATWRSEALRLPCPGYSTSQEGFAQVLRKPKLENRNENELAIWVHPNEEKLGWLEGTYPFIKIEDGDHFKTWVGCIRDYNKCSLKFYLDYKDENGRVHRLEEWIEEYDGEVTIIDLDLSELAGEKVRFILGVEGLTKNVDDAQGFWFTPHISRSN